MNITVCTKQTPDSSSVYIDPISGQVDYERFVQVLDAADACRQKGSTRRKRTGSTRINQQRSKRRQCARDPALAGRSPLRCGTEPGAARALLKRGEWTVDTAISNRHGATGLRGDTRRRQFGAHAAGRVPRRRLTTHCIDLRRDFLDKWDVHRGRIAPRIGRIKSVYVGQQNQLIGLKHFSNPRCQSVIVAEADLRRRHHVILVDYRNAA